MNDIAFRLRLPIASATVAIMIAEKIPRKDAFEKAVEIYFDTFSDDVLLPVVAKVADAAGCPSADLLKLLLSGAPRQD